MVELQGGKQAGKSDCCLMVSDDLNHEVGVVRVPSVIGELDASVAIVASALDNDDDDDARIDAVKKEIEKKEKKQQRVLQDFFGLLDRVELDLLRRQRHPDDEQQRHAASETTSNVESFVICVEGLDGANLVWFKVLLQRSTAPR